MVLPVLAWPRRFRKGNGASIDPRLTAGAAASFWTTGSVTMAAMTLTTLFSLQKGTPGYARLVYAGLLAGLLVPGLNIAAALMAWLGRDAGDAMLQRHALNQLHIFGKSVIYVLIGLVLTYFLFGVLIIVATIVWYILRLNKGLQALSAGAPPENPESWLF
jgi:uncharacterized membrane protein